MKFTYGSITPDGAIHQNKRIFGQGWASLSKQKSDSAFYSGHIKFVFVSAVFIYYAQLLDNLSRADLIERFVQFLLL